MFLNISNHPSSNWSAEQIEAAWQLSGEIVDLPFPVVDPAGDETYIAELADDLCTKVIEINGQNAVVHLMGEMTLTFALVQRLSIQGITCVAATTQREIMEYPDGRKESIFKFVKFRKYQPL